MDNFYLILVIILFALAVSDLIVGVSNDAVNFLNSAIGSKAAPKWIIFGVASLGVLAGSAFSGGMMEVARKGIFHPDMFFFSEIMIIFLAVMITDIILLDMFNTFGLPTSTTVSIVFELLGSAVAVSLVKISKMGDGIGTLSNYINSEKAMAIIFGILISVVIAFVVGAVIQYISRIIFSFRYNKTLKYFGAVFGGIAISAMTYFMIIKGAKGATFMTKSMVAYLIDNMTMILLLSFAFWTIILQLLFWIFKIDIPKVIVLVGTFGLAMAFAGNDLVNFIGVPLAGFQSFKAWIGSGGIAPDSFSMEMLRGKVPTPEYMLIIAGLIMIATLISSKKARKVISTSVDLSRQSEGEERFGSSLFSRIIVRNTVKLNQRIKSILPSTVVSAIDRRFEHVEASSIQKEANPAFDKIRASVNLVVAGILISLGTSLKLPLSTTYVTFMVAMGTSLADRAWGRESAVYRISGVFTVVGGWFMTALIAFSVSAFIAWIICLGGNFMVFVFLGVAILMIIRTHLLFKKRSAKTKEEEEDLNMGMVTTEKVMEKSNKQVVNVILTANQIFSLSINSFLDENRSSLKEAISLKDEFNKKSKKLKNKLFATIEKLQQDSTETGPFYVQSVDYQREVAHSLNFLIEPLYEHLENNHKPFLKSQRNELKELSNLVDEFFNHSLHIIKEQKFDEVDDIIKRRDRIVEKLAQLEKAQIKRIKGKEVNTKNSVLFFNIMSETKNLLLHFINLLKSQRDFMVYTKKELKP